MERMPNASDFPIGSLESRAAARMMLERRRENMLMYRINIVLVGHQDDEPLPEGKRSGVTEFTYGRG
jgi:hypothetical protein